MNLNYLYYTWRRAEINKKYLLR